MYNTDMPTRADLPTSAQLVRSTILAILAAAAILIAVVLPAEYAIDPTGIGRVLGLAEMGEIKSQLAKEAEEDRQHDAKKPSDKRSNLVGAIVSLVLIGKASAQAAPATRHDEISVTLKPNQGTEIKMTMIKGAKAKFSWVATGGVVNFDMHGDDEGAETSYEKGRGVGKAEGMLTAAFDGNHGWFWRNRSRADVTITLRTSGEYSAIKQMK